MIGDPSPQLKMAMFRTYGCCGKGNHQQLYKDLTIENREKIGMDWLRWENVGENNGLTSEKLQVNPLQFYDLQLVVIPKSPSSLTETSRISGHF